MGKRLVQLSPPLPANRQVTWPPLVPGLGGTTAYHRDSPACPFILLLLTMTVKADPVYTLYETTPFLLLQFNFIS